MLSHIESRSADDHDDGDDELVVVVLGGRPVQDSVDFDFVRESEAPSSLELPGGGVVPVPSLIGGIRTRVCYPLPTPCRHQIGHVMVAVAENEKVLQTDLE